MLGISIDVFCQTLKGFFDCIVWNKNRSHLDVRIELFIVNVLLLKTICLDFTETYSARWKNSTWHHYRGMLIGLHSVRLPRNLPSRIWYEVLALIAEIAGTSRSTCLQFYLVAKHIHIA